MLSQVYALPAAETRLQQLKTRNVTGVEDTPRPCQIAVELVGDGDPHQNYLHIQITEPMACGPNDNCYVEHQTAETVGWSVNGGIDHWISGGFAVEQSWTIGAAYGCHSDGADKVAVWHKVAHTAYTARNRYRGDCGHYDEGHYIIWSPNHDNRGGEYYCVRGSGYVRNKGDQYWDYSGRAGGP